MGYNRESGQSGKYWPKLNSRLWNLEWIIWKNKISKGKYLWEDKMDLEVYVDRNFYMNGLGGRLINSK